MGEGGVPAFWVKECISWGLEGTRVTIQCFISHLHFFLNPASWKFCHTKDGRGGRDLEGAKMGPC